MIRSGKRSKAPRRKKTGVAPSRNSILGIGTNINSLPTDRLLARDEEVRQLVHGQSTGVGDGELTNLLVVSNVETISFTGQTPFNLLDWLLAEGQGESITLDDTLFTVSWIQGPHRRYVVFDWSEIINNTFRKKPIHGRIKSMLVRWAQEHIE